MNSIPIPSPCCTSKLMSHGPAAGSHDPPTIDLDGFHEDLAPSGPGHEGAPEVMAVIRRQGVPSAPEQRKPGGHSATHTNVPSRFSNLPRPGKGKCTA
jgi:hypothetical protein